ncbi:MAG: right-handed parallel beta-helix repeat-containing protein, partial [Acidobacteria bacterium]|nr:right-handed parallel beta-helix repeat-containing protein [Acidobacteriota bacterium]
EFQNKTALQDGIELDFEWPVTPGLYTPGDYWTFSVRAGEIKNNSPLINAQPPEGIEYHRVPLATLTWNNPVITFANGDIEDCRHIFRPLTRLSTCCTFRVGDGMHSFGDFDSVQKAIDHLPAGGGEICLLPGVYEEHIKIEKKHNIHIKGCGARSVIKFDSQDPVVYINESNNIKLESLAVVAHRDGVGILLEGPLPKSGDDDEEKELYLHDITLEKLLVRASTRSAIEAHVGQHINICDCTIAINDLRTEWAAVYLTGDDCLIANNEIFIVHNDNLFESVEVPEPVLDPGSFQSASAAQGGLHLGGGSERVRVINNLIAGGIGDGITLGSVDEKDGDDIVIIYDPWWPSGGDKADCDPNPGYVNGGVVIIHGDKKVAGAALHDILIERNRIFNMGRNGIGVDAFFDLEKDDEIISVENLVVIGNRIQHCLNRKPVDIPTKMTDAMGYGGIALADVDNLVVRDNFIEDNGDDYLQPVCGIFILHGDGVEISRNRIRNNGARTSDPSSGVKNGRRGGINIVFGVAPRVDLLPFVPGGVSQGRVSVPFSNGVPAIKIHENVVSVPLGQALSLVALGPVSVVGNQFTSMGMVMSISSPTFIAATVMIFNLGLSNELWLQLLSFMVVNKGQLNIPSQPGSFGDPDPQPGLDDERLGKYLANGNVMFTNNQCQLNLLETGWSIPLSSITILTLDDIAFHNNQCDCDLFDDFVFWQAMLIGMSVRVSDNRFKESIVNALLSAVTYGWINITTDNQATHCMYILGHLYLDRYNIILIDSFLNQAGSVEHMSRHWCERLQRND